jgi:hypothetical protein
MEQKDILAANKPLSLGRELRCAPFLPVKGVRQYIKMISIKTCNRKDLNPIIDHLDILPPILYKYRVFDSEDYGLNYAIYGTAYFPSAKELNDPFETIFKPDSILLHLKGEKLSSYLRKKAKEHFPTADATRINELVQTGLEQKQLLLNGDPRGMQATLENQYSKYGILSLTAVPDSIPMWAYYSDSNKGFCVGLHTHIIAEHQDKLLHENEIFSLQKVRYKKNIPMYNIDRNPKGIKKRILKLLKRLYIQNLNPGNMKRNIDFYIIIILRVNIHLVKDLLLK